MTETPEWALEKIREATHGTTVLDLSGPGWDGSGEPLRQIPEQVFTLQHLQELKLADNQLTSIPDAIARLPRLTTLDLTNNLIETLPDGLRKLEHLGTLWLVGNQLACLPEWLTDLRSLCVLMLGANPLASWPGWLGKLGNLTLLGLGGLPGYQFKDVPEWIAQLANLVWLQLHGHRLTTLPDWFVQLESLKQLYLGNNEFSHIPDVIWSMKHLETLDFSHVARATIGKGPIEYSSCNTITVIPDQILQLPGLKVLRLARNPDHPLEEPPPEIVSMDDSGNTDLERIRSYYRQSADGTTRLYEAKLLIVGEAGAGKTTLAKKIQNRKSPLDPQEKSTEGIEVLHCRFRMDYGRRFKMNIWDFGGQEVYHETHQFFLTKRSLYVLVADTRKEDTDFHYWMNVAALLSDNSPIIIVKNEKQDRHREIDESSLRAEFPTLRKILATNLATDRGLQVVIDEISHEIQQLPLVGAKLPSRWVRVREVLEGMRSDRPYIHLHEYLAICERCGFTSPDNSLELSCYLHDLGVCVHFQEDPILRNLVILDPEWGTKAVYKVLDDPGVIRNRGQFSQADVARIWHEDFYAKMRYELLQLMSKFRLCYPLPGQEGKYIAPQLLTEAHQEYEWDVAGNLLLRYSYEFMPKGILSRLIVVMHPLIEDQELAWKSGVILVRNGGRAEVLECYRQKELRIRVSGQQKKDLMTIIRYELERIHSSFNRLRYKALIPCSCNECRVSQNPHFFEVPVLERFLAANHPAIQCQQSASMVDVRGLMDDVPIGGRQRDAMLRSVSQVQDQYNLRAVHDLLMAAFSVPELRRIFLYSANTDLRPLRHELDVVAGKEDVIEKIIAYCDTRGLLPDLLQEVERANPAQYARFSPQLNT